MSNIMIPFNNQPVETKRLEGSVGTNTYTVPAGKYARISLNVNWGGRAKITYASDSSAGAQTILHAVPDSKEAEGQSYKPSHKIQLFNASNDSSTGAGTYGDVILTLPGDESQILTTYFRIRHISGTSPRIISYFSLYKSSSPAIGAVELLPAHFDAAARAAGTGSSGTYLNDDPANAAPVKLPGNSQVKLRFQAASLDSTGMKIDAWGVIEKGRNFNALTKEIWLVEGDILHLDIADWDGSTAYAHIEEYNVQS